MFDGAILDVVIGMLLLFLVASLIASAVVETVGGFLHRRSKHLWDTLDLLLGNTSADETGLQSIVTEIYTQPFITGLVRPTDRLRFDPVAGSTTRAPARPKSLPARAKARKSMENLPLGAAGKADEPALRRRFYGPTNIHAREFTNALLAHLRPDGPIDQARAAIDQIRDEVAKEPTATDVALDAINASAAALREAADAMASGDLRAAVDQIRQAGGGSVPIEQVSNALHEAEQALGALMTGKPSTAEFAKMLEVAPKDLRVKLLAVAEGVGSDFVDLRSGIEEWYDRNMAAASSWYRKQTRWFLFLAGLVMAVSLNVDSVNAATTLYRDESVRDGLVEVASEVSRINCDTEATSAGAALPEATSADPAQLGDLDLDCFRSTLGETLSFPVGWEDVDTSAQGWALRGLGWLFVGAAVTLGAPFWFDLLGRALARKRKS